MKVIYHTNEKGKITEGGFCPKCGDRVDSRFGSYCGKCGEQLDFPKCLECGWKVNFYYGANWGRLDKWDDGYCTYCGNKLPTMKEWIEQK